MVMIVIKLLMVVRVMERAMLFLSKQVIILEVELLGQVVKIINFIVNFGDKENKDDSLNFIMGNIINWVIKLIVMVLGFS